MAIVKDKTVNDDLIKMTLNSAFQRWCMNNQKLCNMIHDLSKVIIYKGKGLVHIDVNLFPEQFVREYYMPKPKVFADEFIRKLELTIFRALSGIGVRDFELDFTFQYASTITDRVVRYYMLTRMM